MVPATPRAAESSLMPDSKLALSEARPPTPLGAPHLAYAIARDLTRSVGRMLFKKVRRERAVVNAEYEAGRWTEVQRSRAWESRDLRAFLEGDDDTTAIMKMEGRVVRTAVREYYRQRVEYLQRLIAREAGDVEDIVELGCGYGYNLYTLALDPRWRRLSGFDISETGLAVGREIARHFELASRVGFEWLDVTDAANPAFERITGQTVFTYFCIEQIPYAVEKVVENILRFRPRRVIHVEPTTERLNLWRPLDMVNYAYVKSVDYQTRLFTVVEDLASQGRVRVLSDRRSEFAPTIHNDGFILTWEPV
jgi:SAM-dependent methyltransferase